MGTVRYTVINGAVLSENRNGTKRDYLPDPLGSTLALLDNTQTQTDTFSFWPYGEVASRTGTTATPFQFVGTKGYFRDSTLSTAKSYVRRRYLDSARCRWMTVDPIGFKGMDWSLYRYVGNRPTTLTDRYGTAPDCQQKDNPCPSDFIGPVPTFESCATCKAAGGWGCTECNFLAGEMFTMICIYDCTRECTCIHEARHREQLAECCRRIRMCIITTGSYKYCTETIYGPWFAKNQHRRECEGMRIGYACLLKKYEEICLSQGPLRLTKCCEAIRSRMSEMGKNFYWTCYNYTPVRDNECAWNAPF